MEKGVDIERLTRRYELGATKRDITITIGDICEKLADYEDAEEQGLLLRLPCKVGDTIYIVMRLHYQPNGLDMSQYKEIEEVKVDNITIGKPYWQINGDEHEFLVEDFGKSIFLTKEEAEQKLAEMKGE